MNTIIGLLISGVITFLKGLLPGVDKTFWDALDALLRHLLTSGNRVVAGRKFAEVIQSSMNPK